MIKIITLIKPEYTKCGNNREVCINLPIVLPPIKEVMSDEAIQEAAGFIDPKTRKDWDNNQVADKKFIERLYKQYIELVTRTILYGKNNTVIIISCEEKRSSDD